MSSHFALLSTSSFGAPDLDLRPAEPARGTLGSWVQECPHCFYVAGRLDSAPLEEDAVREAMREPRWTALAPARERPPAGGHTLFSRSLARRIVAEEVHRTVARRFVRHAFLLRASKALGHAGEAMLRAAWAADDAADRELAVAWRREAAELLSASLSASGTTSEARQQTRVRLVDIRRRAGDWEEASALCRELLMEAPGGIIEAVLNFEAALIERGDLECHTVAEVKPV
jgi:hypothetical protein